MHKQTVQPGGNCKYCNKFCKYLHTLTAHEKRCLNNPNRIEWNNSHPVSEETKQKIKVIRKNLKTHKCKIHRMTICWGSGLATTMVYLSAHDDRTLMSKCDGRLG